MFRKVVKVLTQNLAWASDTWLRDIQLPTDFPISRVVVRLSGTPAGTTSGAGNSQNALWPALCNVLGSFTIEGKPLDGAEGVKVRNMPAGPLWLRSWLMKGVQPEVTDLSTTIATACNVTVPIQFMDERLPFGQQLVTALDAPRYSGQQGGLTLKIQTGFLQAATGANIDRVGIQGGTYVGAGAGTLAVTVSVEQLVPLSGAFPPFNAANAIPSLDLNLEYQASPAITQAAANGMVLNDRGIQAETIWMSVDRNANFLETAVNNLGITPIPQIIEKLGSQQANAYDPAQLRADNLEEYLPAALAFPDGVYARNDWGNDLVKAYQLYKQAASHTYDLNKAATTLTDSAIRLLHVSYSPSRRAKPSLGV